VKTHLILFYRDGCHLCDVMLHELQSYLQIPDVEFKRIDIDEHPEWLQRYNSLVPVLHVNDEPVCKYVLDKERLEEFLDH
jgi:hypothetical protein